VRPKAIPAEDRKQILKVITGVRDRALILLLLHTGMRIGELLKVKMADIVLSERKILLYLGEKNLHGRTVFYSTTAELALNKWLATRETTSEYLFSGYGGKQLCYVTAWMIMKDACRKRGLKGKATVCIPFAIRSPRICSTPGCDLKCCSNSSDISPSI